MADITQIKIMLAQNMIQFAEKVLPNGVLRGNEWCVGSIGGERGNSLKLCVKGQKTGVWSDFATGETGDAIDLWREVYRVDLPDALAEIRKWLGVESPRDARADARKPYRRPKLRTDTTKPDNVQTCPVAAYLRSRGITDTAIAAYRVGAIRRGVVLPSYLPDGTLANVKYLGIDLGPDGKKVIRTEAGCEPVLFGWQAITNRNERRCVITEGEIDAMSAWVYGLPAPMSVPFGGGKGAKQQWIESEFDRLAQFEVIYLALDMDDEGETAAEEIANRLGRNRCRRVKLPRKDLNQCLMDGVPQSEIEAAFAGAEVLKHPKLAKPSDFIEAVRGLFWPKEGAEPGYSLPWQKAAGKVRFRPGELTIWTGSTGAGKSQLLGHALVAMGEQGARACVASLEMAPPYLFKRMVKQAGFVDRPTDSYLDEVMGWLDGWLYIYNIVGKEKVTAMTEAFDYARCRYGCDVFVVDSLMRLGVSSEDYEGQEKAIYDLVTFAISGNVHVHLVAHARKEDRSRGAARAIPDAEDVKGTSEISSNAANVISVWRNKAVEEEISAGTFTFADGKFPVIVNVAKQRNGDYTGKFGLFFDVATYQYRESESPREGRAYVGNKS